MELAAGGPNGKERRQLKQCHSAVNNYLIVQGQQYNLKFQMSQGQLKVYKGY